MALEKRDIRKNFVEIKGNLSLLVVVHILRMLNEQIPVNNASALGGLNCICPHLWMPPQ